jgi:hypothetical protein
MASSTVRLAEVIVLVRRLPPEDHERLVEQIELGLGEDGSTESLEGLWAGGDPMPSLEDMQAARRDLWGDLDDDELP